MFNYRGSLTLTNSTISGNSTYKEGGGIGSLFGAVTVTNSTISGNSGGGGGGAANRFGTMTITNSTISENSSFGVVGGGVKNLGTTTITNSTISDNSTSGHFARGGGVFNEFTLRVTNSTISGNSTSGDGASGGGVSNTTTGIMTLTNSTISGNSSSGNGARGGGVSNSGYDLNSTSSLTLTNSTISGNSTSGSGGGVSNQRYGILTLTRTLVSGNTAQVSGSELYNSKYFGSVTAANFNLFGHSGLTNVRAFRNFTPGASDITATSNGNTPTKLSNVLNTTLVDNGGPTKTHKIGLVSPALDAVINGTCPPPARDQRGKRRPQDGDGDGGIACDIGSFERGPPHL